MPNLELAQKTHDLLYYLENPRIYDSGKNVLLLDSGNQAQHVVSNIHLPVTPVLRPTLLIFPQRLVQAWAAVTRHGFLLSFTFSLTVMPTT